jgi:steroid 5-alpha reductase family enzyme
MIISSLPSLVIAFSDDQQLVWIIICMGLFYISYIMYTTLVYYTGAVPSEFYTLQKRPNYKEYQEQTNMFFPGPNKNKINIKYENFKKPLLYSLHWSFIFKLFK